MDISYSTSHKIKRWEMLMKVVIRLNDWFLEAEGFWQLTDQCTLVIVELLSTTQNKPKMAYSHELLKMAFMDYIGFSWTIMDYHELSWTILDNPRLDFHNLGTYGLTYFLTSILFINTIYLRRCGPKDQILFFLQLQFINFALSHYFEATNRKPSLWPLPLH